MDGPHAYTRRPIIFILEGLYHKPFFHFISLFSQFSILPFNFILITFIPFLIKLFHFISFILLLFSISFTFPQFIVMIINPCFQFIT
ncbi:hypothetical protein Lalb_Chr07g0188721 [Lupinus albus]|uniref:Uncharacterized protein n=1 Tax=Lupinus albus TaxID=3870 RepID=A0A6A4Q9N0_LUPAL|nr:hypothetical protein Lalb_Chr07g0188721 [Lupinus albus]